MWGIEYSKTKKMEIFDLLDDKRVNFRKLDQQETCMVYPLDKKRKYIF